jgi:predicted transcriptional regulator
MSFEPLREQQPVPVPESAQQPEPEPAAGQVKPDDTGTVNLTNPKAMRALAHPVRIALLEILGIGATLTATQASEMLGESPANCAFHLRTLAKYGLVREAGGGRGRERPWVAAHRSFNISPYDQKDKQTELAALTLAGVWLERWLDRIRQVFTRNSWPDGWADVVRANRHTQFLTPEETNQVAEEIAEIFRRYEDRRYDPSLRPAGALPAEFILFGFPRTELSTDLNADT